MDLSVPWVNLKWQAYFVLGCVCVPTLLKAQLVKHQSLTGERENCKRISCSAVRVDLFGFEGPDPPPGTVVRQTNSDVTIGQCLVYDSNLARAILTRHKTLADGGVKNCLLP